MDIIDIMNILNFIDIMDIMYILDIMDIMDPIDIMDSMDIMDIMGIKDNMDIMNITITRQNPYTHIFTLPLFFWRIWVFLLTAEIVSEHLIINSFCLVVKA